MASSSLEEELYKNMIMTFTVSELQFLLGFVGRNKNGKKHELQARVLEFVKLRSSPMQSKIRDLYKASQQVQNTMMGQGSASGGSSAGSTSGAGQPLFNPVSMGYGSISAAAAMMGLTGAYPAAQQLSLQGRNPYATPVSTPGYTAAQQANLYNYQLQQQQHQQQQQQQQPSSSVLPSHGSQQRSATAVAASSAVPVQPDVKLVKLPFYDAQAELLRPSSLVAQGNNRFQEAQFQFFLTPCQATDIASHRDIRMGSKLDYLYQIQLRFCPLSLDSSKEMTDEFPPGITLQMNGKVVVLPNPIPTNRPGVEPKRPPKPCNITSYCKLSPILPNSVNVKWAAEYGKGWVVGIWLVMKCTSEDLLERLKKRGIRNPEHTRKSIIVKMTDDDDVATECLRVSVACPLGKMRMTLPCRPTTCNHLQCFDASLFLQMNERKSTWNCPVCDSKALFDDLMIDGYFTDVINSTDLPKDQNDIILNPDGSWKPVPKEEENGKTSSKDSSEQSRSAAAAAGSVSGNSSSESVTTNGNAKKDETQIDCIDLSDDDDAIPSAAPSSTPAAPAPPPLPTSDPAPPPPPPPPEIECIDLE